MRTGDIVTAIVVTLLAGVAFLLWSRPLCACSPVFPHEDRRPAVIDSAFRVIEAAESTLYARRGRFARGMKELDVAGLPADVRIASIAATDSTWTARLEAEVNGGRIGCLTSGRRASAGREYSRLSFCDSRVRVDSTSTRAVLVMPGR
jgi:hypothetical protein